MECIPFHNLKRKEDDGLEYSKMFTGLYLDCMEQAAQISIFFARLGKPMANWAKHTWNMPFGEE